MRDEESWVEVLATALAAAAALAAIIVLLVLAAPHGGA